MQGGGTLKFLLHDEPQSKGASSKRSSCVLVRGKNVRTIFSLHEDLYMKKLTLKRDFIANHTNVIMGALFWQKCVIRLWRGGGIFNEAVKKNFC